VEPCHTHWSLLSRDYQADNHAFLEASSLSYFVKVFDQRFQTPQHCIASDKTLFSI